MRRQLAKMVVVITGASSGIGLELARQLAAKGALLVLGARRIDRLESLNQSLGGGHLCLATDVSRPADCQQLIAHALERFGRIDTLVCNAGYGQITAVSEMTADAMMHMWQTNVIGITECIRCAVPHLRQQAIQAGWRGQIMITSSAAARRGLPFFGAYSATKAACLSLAEALRVELRPDRIAVTSVHPIGTDSDFFTSAETRSGLKMPPRALTEIHQAPATVAAKMLRAIERPRAELWPFAPARILLSLATLCPQLVDRIMWHHRRVIADHNPRP